MGKYANKRKKKNNSWRMGGLIVLLAILAGAVLLTILWSKPDISEQLPTSSSQQESQTTGNDSSGQDNRPAEEAALTEEDKAAAEVNPPESSLREAEVLLADGLRISDIRSYAGVYMEDGSDEIVSDVLMIILENTSEQDLQLARIDIRYPEVTAEFEATNLPAGEKAVLLEKNRRSMPEEGCTSIESRNVSFFQTPMTLMEDTFEITGGNGYLDVKNISGSAIDSKVYVYYKHTASDILYGGITFRATVDQSIAAGETIRILTNHCTAENSRILAVTCSE